MPNLSNAKNKTPNSTPKKEAVCNQYDETVIESMTDEAKKQIMGCNGEGKFEDMLLNRYFLDFNWHQKPNKRWNTEYNYDDVLGRVALNESRGFPVLVDTDIKTPSNRGSKTLYVKLSADKKEYEKILLNCDNGGNGLSPEEYLEAQEAIIDSLRLMIDLHLKGLVTILDFSKTKSSIEQEFVQTKEGEKLYEPDLKLKYEAAVKTYSDAALDRNDSIQMYKSAHDMYNSSLEREKGLNADIAKQQADIATLQKPDKKSKMQIWASIKQKYKEWTATDNTAMIANLQESIKENQSEISVIKKNESIIRIQFSYSVQRLPLDTHLDNDEKKLIYNTDPSQLKQIATAASPKSGGSAPAKGKAQSAPVIDYSKLTLVENGSRAPLQTEVTKLETVYKEVLRTYESVFNKNERKRVTAINQKLGGVNKKFAFYKQLMSSIAAASNNDSEQEKQIVEQIKKLAQGDPHIEELHNKLRSLKREDKGLTKNNALLNHLVHIPESMSEEGVDLAVSSLKPNELPVMKGAAPENKISLPSINKIMSLI